MPCLSEKWAREVWDRLRRAIRIERDSFVVHFARTPFEVLVAIVLSQNTNEANAIRALRALRELTNLKPENIRNTPIAYIERAIRPAGMYRQKARTIIEIARRVSEGLNLESILDLDLLSARQKLLAIPGIGKKTADVFLAIYGKRIMGLDVHALRIAKRWGFSSKTYDGIQREYIRLFSFVENYDMLHKTLITLGRTYCRAKRPRCHKCPIGDICPRLI